MEASSRLAINDVPPQRLLWRTGRCGQQLGYLLPCVVAVRESGERVGSKRKRADYRRPDVAGARIADPVPPAATAPERPRRRDGGGAWWPLGAAAGLTFVLVLLIVLGNLDSPPIPSAP